MMHKLEDPNFFWSFWYLWWLQIKHSLSCRLLSGVWNQKGVVETFLHVFLLVPSWHLKMLNACNFIYISPLALLIPSHETNSIWSRAKKQIFQKSTSLRHYLRLGMRFSRRSWSWLMHLLTFPSRKLCIFNKLYNLTCLFIFPLIIADSNFLSSRIFCFVFLCFLGCVLLVSSAFLCLVYAPICKKLIMHL